MHQLKVLKCGKEVKKNPVSHKMCNRHSGPLCPFHALQDTRAEVALLAGEDNICKGKQKNMTYIPGPLLQLTATSVCVYISCFVEAKCEMDQRAYYLLCHNIRLDKHMNQRKSLPAAVIHVLDGAWRKSLQS